LGAKSPRRPDLDILRVACIVLLVFFHAAMPFNSHWDWFVINDERSGLLLEFSFFLSRWRMALLYTIAGIGTAFALRGRSPSVYLRERSKRLLIPILVAVLVLVPPQVAAERIREGAQYANVTEFLRTYLNPTAYPDGSWSWHHMWFVAYLFVYSVALLPLFIWVRDRADAQTVGRLERFLGRNTVYLLALPMGILYALLIPRFNGPQDIFRDWAMFLVYGCTFLYGYLIADRSEVWDGIVARRRTSFAWALAIYLFVNIFRWNETVPPQDYRATSIAYLTLLGGMPWLWVLAILGYGRKYLTQAPKWLPYANEAAYPVYILHQTVVVGIAFFLVQTSEPVISKYLFLASVSLLATVAIYHAYVRPFPFMRFLMGMKPRPVPPL
jgi:peptidoglycan/LPS O-acetylase OafA/YrhL